MTTKNDFLVTKDLSFNSNPFNVHDVQQQYSNLNLNQTYKSSNVTPVQSNGKSIIDKKIIDTTVSNEGKSFNKSTITNLCSNFSNTVTINSEVEEETKKRWKNGSSSNKASSTLSLHIAAYENSIEADSSGRNDKMVKNEKTSPIKKGKKNVKQVFSTPTFIQNPYEFPRQQEKNYISNPEVMQFKTSQRLFDPNESSASNQQAAAETTTSEASSSQQPQVIISQPEVLSTPQVQQQQSQSSSLTTTPPPSAILVSNDGTFRLDLTSFNLSPHDLATITAAFNATINSPSTFISTVSCAAAEVAATASSNVLSSTSLPTMQPPGPPSSTTSSKLVMKDTPKTRRQRAKHSIVPADLLISPERVPGTFLNITQAEFDAIVNDNETALAFAAKVGLIKNVRRCPKCERDMALCKFNNSCGYRWVCRRTENGKRFTCSVRGMRKDTILDDRLVGILTMLRIMYHFSKNVSDSEIINRLDIGHVRSARTILARLRDMVDEEVSKLSTDPLLTAEELRQHFLMSDVIDHFGFILFWGTRYKVDKSSAGAATSSSPDSTLNDSSNITQNSIISEETSTTMAIKTEEEDAPNTESMEAAADAIVNVKAEEEARPETTNLASQAVKYETESEEPSSSSSSASSAATCSTAKEQENDDQEEEPYEINFSNVKHELVLSESSDSNSIDYDN